MKFSKYNYLFKSENYGYLNYNSITNSFIKLDEDLCNMLINNDFKDLDGNDIEKLKELKVIVNKNFDNDYYLELKTAYYSSVFNKQRLSLTIAPTLNCNFDCTYCYELNKTNKNMSFDTADKVIEFIKSYKHLDDIEITWYGGEPLLVPEVIEYLYDKLLELNIPIFEHGMISNGFLINNKNLELLKKLNLDYIQITFDGLQETHNKKRRHKNDKINTYDVILNNVGKILTHCTNTKTIIRIHVDANNQNEFYPLYNKLMTKWSSSKIAVYPAFIEGEINSCGGVSCLITEHESKYKFYENLYKDTNLEIDFFPKHHIGGCHANNINGFVLGPDGELYKCWHDVGIEERIIGTVDSNHLNNKGLMFQYLIDSSKFEDETCKNCFLLPVCSGGCSFLRIYKKIKGKDNSSLLCSIGKEYLKELLELYYEQLNEKNRVACNV